MKKTYMTPSVDVICIDYSGMLCTSGLSETLNADDIINTDNDMLAPVFSDDDFAQTLFSE